jgi:hypothetical protein
MNTMIKAPDLGVVKSLAKALRAQLPKTAQVSHSKALEIAANSFGFSNWHACRTHFDRLKAGSFDPPTVNDRASVIGTALLGWAVDFVARLETEPALFEYNRIRVNALSAGRSMEGFLFPLIELGARHEPDPRRVEIDERSASDIGYLVNTGREVPFSAPILGGRLLFGSGSANTPPSTIILISPERLPAIVDKGLREARAYEVEGAVRLDLLIGALRDQKKGGEGPRVLAGRDRTFAIQQTLLVEISRACQARINAATP